MSLLGPTAGLWMLLALVVLTLCTGLPVWMLLVGVSSAFSVAGLLVGTIDLPVLSAVPARLVGLLESDLLQALPLYVLVGLLLQRLAIADALFAVLMRWLAPLGGGQALGALALGALVAPMNGSVASSASLLGRLVAPRLGGMNVAHATALVSVAATIGVVVPPSLVLIFLGDAMLRAHTEASNLPGFVLGQARIINTQDVFHAALLPAMALLVLWGVVASWQNKGSKRAAPSVPRGQTLSACCAIAGILGLLVGVYTGQLFAVEAAAAAAMVLLVLAVADRTLSAGHWKQLLVDTLALSGALMALLIGATVLSLVFRLFGTDRWIAALIQTSTLGPAVTAALVLFAVALCAWVLDAFEMIFVVIPIVAPTLIALLGDAQQVAVLLLMVLQLSFLVPPMGYAVLMARASATQPVRFAPLARAIAPFVVVQLLVLAGVFLLPQTVHQLDAKTLPVVVDSEQDIERQMKEMSATPQEPKP